MVEAEQTETKLTVLLFGTLKDAAGGERVAVGVPSGENVTVANLISFCSAQYPTLAPWLPYVRVAVNQEYADSQQVIGEGDEIALLPPVSGG